jgi:RES domain
MWTPAALLSEAQNWKGNVWRTVESQAKVSTMRLTDTLDEQELLERILERSKPKYPPELIGFNYLLYTPFRYAPYPHGSRFRRAEQREGAFYSSETPSTSIAETSFYRLLFFVESPQTELPASPLEHTTFSVAVRIDRCLNLFAPPLVKDEAIWRNPNDYTGCQDLADAAREAGVQALRYLSVRDPAGGTNCALLSVDAFAERNPRQQQTWHIFPGLFSIRAWCESPRQSLEFKLADFKNDARIAALMAPLKEGVSAR